MFQYHKVPGDKYGDEAQQAVVLHSKWPMTVDKRCGSSGPLLKIGALLQALVIAFLSFRLYLALQTPDEHNCLRQRISWSPAADGVLYEWKTYDSGFGETKYVGPPTQAREEAWDSLWPRGLLRIPLERLSKLNKTMDRSWKYIPSNLGGGIGGSLELFHHLHCLNLIRQYTYRDSYDYGSSIFFQQSEKQIRAHVDHCIDNLRMSLMCIGDITPYLVWEDPQSITGEFSDFNTLHRCLNFEVLVDWFEQNIAAPESTEILPSPSK